MNKLIMLLLAALIAINPCIAESAQPQNEIFAEGKIISFSGSADGSVYLLDRANKIIKIGSDGSTSIINIPAVSDAKPDDHFSDLIADGGMIALCGYPFSGIYVISSNDPGRLTVLPLSIDDKKINPMMISRRSVNWYLKDAEERVLAVSPSRNISVLPKYSQIETDKNGKAVIVPPPVDTGKGIVYPGKVFAEDNHSVMWEAPAPKAPRQIMAVDFLGSDKSGSDFYMVITASGELDAENIVYSVRSGKILASAKIPGNDVEGMMRHCKLSADGSVLYAVPASVGKEGVMIKRLLLAEPEK